MTSEWFANRRTDIDTHTVEFKMVALRALVAIVAAGLGALLSMGRKRVSHKVLCAMVSLAAGALLAVTVIHIIPETMELAGPGFLLPIGSLLFGTAVFAGIGKYVYSLCPACAASASENDSGYLRLGILLMVALGIHSTVDGLAISAGSAAGHGHGAGGVSALAMMILIAVSYHKVPEGMALASLARLAGYTRAKALAVTLLIELTTAAGALIGIIFMGGITSIWLGVILGVVAGSFLYTVGFALLKEMYAHEKGSIILYVLIGFASILLAGFLLSYVGVHDLH